VPPDVLLIALAIGARRKSFKYALICSVGSALGAVLGYVFGMWLYDWVGRPIIDFYGLQEQFDWVKQKYVSNAFLWISVAGFTPIPFKVFTIAAGMTKVNLLVLLSASAFSRSARFFLVGGMVYVFGPGIRRFIEKYFNLLTVVFVVLLILGFIVLKWFR